MPPKYDASKLLYARLENDRFLHKLNVSETDKKTLVDARKKGRKAIRQAFHQAKHILQEDFDKFNQKNPPKEFVTGSQREFVDITPAFMPQGSFSYNTMNNPACTPPQQFDLDDGVYLPMDIFEDMPIYSKDLFFKIVDEALQELAKAEGWQFIRKDTCSRIIISTSMHLDFPMYAMPIQRYEELKQKNEVVFSQESNSYDFNEAIYDSIILDPDDVYLAVRNEKHWIKSDPKQIELWFKGRIEVHGKRLTRVCRYFKSWRDFTWLNGGPSSIVLMVNVVDVFNRNKSFNRDCEAILEVSKELPELFGKDIYNPAINEQEEMFQSRHSEEEVINIISKSEELYTSIKTGLVHAKTKQEVVDQFRNSFGDRIPNNTLWVSELSTSSLSSTPKKQPKPVVKNITHG